MKTLNLSKEGREPILTRVDDDVYESVKDFLWRLHNQGYAVRYEYKPGLRRTAIMLHWAVLPRKQGFEVDHINRDKLDNRSENLRYVTKSQNNANSIYKKRPNKTGYRGVSMKDNPDVWYAGISIGGKKRSLGRYTSPEDAARAYDVAATELYGGFAITNFPIS